MPTTTLFAIDADLTALHDLLHESRGYKVMAGRSSAIKWPGGKSYLAPKIIALMPPRCKNPNAPEADDPGWLHYVEPYAGSLAVLLANEPEGISEVANDLNGELSEFWKVMQGDDEFDKFHRLMTAHPFSQVAWTLAKDPGSFRSHPWNRAVSFFVRCRQSLAGRMDSFAPLSKNRTRRGMNEQAAAWLSAVDGLPAVHERLKRVVILNSPAIDVVRQQDGPRTLFYLDPPYMHETRETTHEYGEHEMDEHDHGELLETLTAITGRFLLSGYPSKRYGNVARAAKWNRHDFKIKNHASGAKKKKHMTESIWTNY